MSVATVEPPVKVRMKKSALARELGVSRVTLDKYLNRNRAPIPDEEFAYDVEAVAEFISRPTDEVQKNSLASWEMEKRRLQCEEIAMRLKIQSGKYITKEEAQKTITPLMAELGELLVKEFELVNPSKYKGRDQVECAAINRKSIDLVIGRFKQGVKGFTG
jgi:hypothetical protein